MRDTRASSAKFNIQLHMPRIVRIVVIVLAIALLLGGALLAVRGCSRRTSTVGDGGIAISGSNGTAMVSTLSGVVVYQGGDNTVSVAPGMYIVRAAGAVKKVLVK